MSELVTELTGLCIAAVGRMSPLAAACASLESETTLDSVSGLTALVTDRNSTPVLRMTLPATRTGHLTVAVLFGMTILVAAGTVGNSAGGFFVAGLVAAAAGGSGAVLDDMTLLLTVMASLRACNGSRRPEGDRRSSEHLVLSFPRSP